MNSSCWSGWLHRRSSIPHYVLDARTATPHFPGIGRYVTSLTGALLPLLDASEHLTVLHAPEHPLSVAQHARVDLMPIFAGPFGVRQQWQLPRLLQSLGAGLYHSAYYLMPYRPGVPTVLTVYDLIPMLLPKASSRRAALLFRWTMALGLRVARRIITLSDAARRDIARVFGPELPLTVIPAAADPAFMLQSPDVVVEVRARYALPRSFVLYVGSNKPHKNLVRLVEAWHLVQREWGLKEEDLELVIAGAWDPRYTEARDRAAALGVQRVRWLGPVTGSDLPALYSAATAFVFPSLYEGFGLPPLEAMASGTPVACSHVSSLPEVVGEAALLFDPSSAGAIAGALRRLITGADLRAELRERGLQQAARFSWTNAAAATLQVYRDAVG